MGEIPGEALWGDENRMELRRKGTVRALTTRRRRFCACCIVLRLRRRKIMLCNFSDAAHQELVVNYIG